MSIKKNTIHVILVATLLCNSLVVYPQVQESEPQQTSFEESEPSWWDKLTARLGFTSERKRSLSKNKKKIGLITAGAAATIGTVLAVIYGGHIQYQNAQVKRLMAERLKEISENMQKKSLEEMEQEFAQYNLGVHFATKADLNKYLKSDRTPLMEAVRAGDYDLAFNLINAGANLDLQSKAMEMDPKTGKKVESGKTALIMATNNANIKLVELLVVSGAQLDIKDNKGRTALGNAEFIMNKIGKKSPSYAKYEDIRNFLANVGMTLRFKEEKRQKKARVPSFNQGEIKNLDLP